MRGKALCVSVGIVVAVAAALFFARHIFVVRADERDPNPAIAQPQPSEQLPVAHDAVKTEKVSLIFAGDIMLDRNVYLKTRAVGNFAHPFLLIEPELAKYDVRIANLEGPVTETSFDAARAHAMSFTFNPAFIPELAKRFDIVSLANNHTLNFGETGLKSTRAYLEQSHVEYFGDPSNRAAYVAKVFEKNGFKIALVGYHAFGAPESQSIPVVVDVIKKLRGTVDWIGVMPHWGVEYQPTPSSAQVYAAHAFIDAGADAIIGGHPHVVETTEQYNGKPIYYSLGNFIFDQYFSKETMEGIMVNVELTRTANEIAPAYKVIPFKINSNSQPYMP